MEPNDRILTPVERRDLEQILAATHRAEAEGIGTLSHLETLIAAFVLNRPDWLADMDYSLAQAVERVGAKLLALIPRACMQLDDEAVAIEHQAERDRAAAMLSSPAGPTSARGKWLKALEGEVSELRPPSEAMITFIDTRTETYGLEPISRPLPIAAEALPICSRISAARSKRFWCLPRPKNVAAVSAGVDRGRALQNGQADAPDGASKASCGAR